mgnify:CR=1 FL=1
MAGKKKNGNKATPVEIVVLITAILNLVRTLIDLIIRLTE